MDSAHERRREEDFPGRWIVMKVITREDSPLSSAEDISGDSPSKHGPETFEEGEEDQKLEGIAGRMSPEEIP